MVWWVVDARLVGGASGPGAVGQPAGPGRARRLASVSLNWWAHGQRVGNRRVGFPDRFTSTAARVMRRVRRVRLVIGGWPAEQGCPLAEVVSQHGTRQPGSVGCVVS